MRRVAIASSCRTDDQLLFIMDHTREWTVNGRAGIALGVFGSLREALRAVFRFERDGVPVFAVCHRPADDVIVFREQVTRLADTDGKIAPALQPSERDRGSEIGASVPRRTPADGRAARSRPSGTAAL